MSAADTGGALAGRRNPIDLRFMGATVRLGNQLAWKTFPTETVVLDLSSGTYYGLNHTAGRMLELLAEIGRVRTVADGLAEEFEASPSRIQSGLCEFCKELHDRGLIELAEPLG